MAKLKSGSHRFANEHGEDLSKFLYDAQIKVANGELKPVAGDDGGSVIEWIRGVWRYRELRYGGEPFGGMIIVFFEGEACFVMQYRGRVEPYADNPETVRTVVTEALRRPYAATPWRGPRKYVASCGLQYRNQWKGSLRNFSGTETVVTSRKGNVLYEAHYNGMIVNKD